MTVSFRNKAGDLRHQYAFLATQTVTGRLCLAVMLALPALGPAALLFSTPPGAAEHFPVAAFLVVLGIIYAVLALSVLGAFALAAWMMPEFTITLEPEHFCMIYLRSSKIPWLTFQRVAETPKSYGFIGWQRLIFVPKHAFASPADADRFFRMALTYWHAAKGTVPPTGHPTDLQEPGGIAER